MQPKEQIEIAARLRSFYAKNQEERFAATLRRWIEDPVRPKTDKGNLRVNPVLVWMAAIALLAGGTFLLFSLF
jgi:hypothetical protein